tara:strand:+ start:205 stop:396 length:192 start_codon:yes stop_codon:yes gene_type:complete
MICQPLGNVDAGIALELILTIVVGFIVCFSFQILSLEKNKEKSSTLFFLIIHLEYRVGASSSN